MGNISKSTTARNVAANAITAQVNLGSLYPNGHVSIYTSDSTKITFHSLSVPAFGPAVDGTATAYPIMDATGMVSPQATASYFAFENCDGSSMWLGNVTLTGNGGALQLDSLVIPKDSTVVISSAKYQVPV